jgi:hypothetical protein
MTEAQQQIFEALRSQGWTASAIMQNVRNTLCGDENHLFCQRCEPELFEGDEE